MLALPQDLYPLNGFTNFYLRLPSLYLLLRPDRVLIGRSVCGGSRDRRHDFSNQLDVKGKQSALPVDLELSHLGRRGYDPLYPGDVWAGCIEFSWFTQIIYLVEKRLLYSLCLHSSDKPVSNQR